MFATVHRYAQLESDLWPGIGPAQMGLGQPGKVDASAVPVGWDAALWVHWAAKA